MNGDNNKFFIINIWNMLKIKWKLLLIILPTSIIPLIVVILFTSFRIYQHLEEQGKIIYTTLLTQVKNNIDFVYEQYARTLTNMMQIPAVQEEFNNPKPYMSQLEETERSKRMIGDTTTRGGLRNTFEEKIDGILYIIELDRKSIKDQTSYKIHRTVGGQLLPNIEKLLSDPLFQKIKTDNSVKLIFGRFREGVIPGINSANPVLIFPYYSKPPENVTDTFEKFFLITLNSSFIPKFYSEIKPLKFGTLYILDRYNNIISMNHPNSTEDYYTFDEEKREYILGKDNPNDPAELLSFEDYKMLNSDIDILKNKDIVKLLDNISPENYKKLLDNDQIDSFFNQKRFVTFKNKKFLTLIEYGKSSETKYIYFHPVKQFVKPIYNVVRIILIITLFFILLIILISYLFSKTFTTPISKLVEGTKIIAQGDYTHFIETDNKDEIGDLSNNFNQMIRNIKSYQDKLLSAEREKSELELASRIQTCLLPSVPQREHYEITATMIPAAEVGGDYYDIIGETDGRIWLGIGDVSGHGLTSGLIMMMAQTAFNTILLNDPDIPSDKLIAQVNKVMYQNIKQRLGEDHFMTLSFMVANPDGTVRFSGAHLDVLVYRVKTKKVERIETTGIWLGLIPDIQSGTVEKEFKLESGDLMLLYTDGLIEAANKNNQQYDIPRLIKKLEEWGDRPIKEIESLLINDVFSFLYEQKDDITFVIARKK